MSIAKINTLLFSIVYANSNFYRQILSLINIFITMVQRLVKYLYEIKLTHSEIYKRSITYVIYKIVRAH
ncbi:hypothetical protein DFQ03_2873 [Maribacter caenipelagi]|uniref:Uncharacterized protein n=1 Tax=Maribacter caenipelagi TaxID=1447781 RepID=A0A4R7CYB3_9FLAO|nr:hypothetical protein DFQ03_2873 [Maribacter caenipelagi]